MVDVTDRRVRRIAQMITSNTPSATPDLGQYDPITLMQGQVTNVGMGNVEILFGDQLEPIPGLSFLSTYRPHINDIVWVWKNGPDWVVIGPVEARAANASEDWHYIGDTELGEPAFLNGWLNFGGDYAHMRYYKDSDGRVHWEGVVDFPTAGSAKTVPICTAPVGYRPEYTVRHVVSAAAGGGGSGIFAVEWLPNGTVQAVGANNGNSIGLFVSVCGVSYMAAGDTEYDRIQEWVPPGLTFHDWSWDADVDNHTPPGLWDRWDGLMVMRNRMQGGTGGYVGGLTERSCRTRWDKLFTTYAFDGTLNLQPIRLDARISQRVLVRVGSSFNQELSLEGLHWLSDIPEHYWTPIDLENSWVNYSVAGNPQGKWGPAAWFKDGYDHVHLRGLIAGGTTAASTIMGLMPPECRPEGRLIFPSLSGGETPGRIDVFGEDILQAQSGTVSNTYYSLDNISYRADPNFTL